MKRLDGKVDKMRERLDKLEDQHEEEKATGKVKVPNCVRVGAKSFKNLLAPLLVNT